MEKKALELAKKYHSKKRRRDGSNYVIHPIRVAKNVSQLTSDKEVISAAYLHDTIEESIENLELLKKLKKEIHELSPKVLEYVEMLTHEKNKDNYESYIKKNFGK